MNTGNKINTRTEQILYVMRFLAWIAFIALMIEAGAILLSYCVSIVNPEAAKKLYTDLNLYALREFSFWHYTLSVTFMVALSVMKASVCFLLIRALSKVNLMNPFTIDVARILEKISYTLLGASLIAMLGNAHRDWLADRTGTSLEEWPAGELMFVAGLVFIISQVFRRGVEIQTENDLTV